MPRVICQDCYEQRGKHRPATCELDGRHLCDSCTANRSEAAHEQFIEQFFGGSYGPDEAKLSADLRDAGRRW